MSPRLGALVLGLLGVALVVGAWALLLAVGVLPKADIPTPVALLNALVHQLGQSTFWAQVWQTLRAAFLGLVIAFVIALPLSIAIGYVWPIRAALNPVVQFLRPVPGIALIPAAALLLGPTAKMDVALVTWGCTWPLLVQLTNGVQGVPRTSLITARAFGLSPLARVRWVIVPASLPFVATGLRIAAVIALIVAVSVELIGGAPGLGNAIRTAQDALNIDTMYALMVAAGLLGVVIHMIFARAERHYLRWQPSRNGRN